MWVPLQHCSRNCGFHIPPLPEVEYSLRDCLVGCCNIADGLLVEAQVEEPCVGGKFATAPPGVKCSDGEVRMITVDVASEGYKPLPWDDDTLSAAQKLQHAGCSIVSSFTDFDGNTTQRGHFHDEYTIEYGRVKGVPSDAVCPTFPKHVRTVVCDVAEKPPLTQLLDPPALAQTCRDLPLAETYRINMLTHACDNPTAQAALDKCAQELESYLAWGVAGESYSANANNLWSDTTWWPRGTGKEGEMFFRPPVEAPPAFQTPHEWARKLDSKIGCEKYDFNSSAFDHIRALYNVSGWESVIPGVNEDADGTFTLKSPDVIDESSVSVSCQLFGEWDLPWYDGTANRFSFSRDRGDGVIFQENGRRFFSRESVGAIAGKISDGPGDYGDYTTDIILGVSFRFLSATYTPDPVDPQSGGTIKIVFQDSVLDSILAENAPAAWTVGSSICLFAEPSWIAIENANDLAGKDAIIREIDLEAMTITVSSPVEVEGPVEIAVGSGGKVARAIDSVCFPHGGGCVPGNYTGTRCAWEVETPQGQSAVLTFEALDLTPDVDYVYIYEVSGLDTASLAYEELMTGGQHHDREMVASITGRMSPAGAATEPSTLVNGQPADLSTRTFRSKFGGKLLVVLNTRGGNGRSVGMSVS